LSYASAGQPSNRVTMWRSNGQLEAFVFPPPSCRLPPAFAIEANEDEAPSRLRYCVTHLTIPVFLVLSTPPRPKNLRRPQCPAAPQRPGTNAANPRRLGPKPIPNRPPILLTMRNRRTHPTPTDSAPWGRSGADDRA